MTNLTQPREMTVAPALASAADTDLETIFSLSRLAPDQIAGAYSLIARNAVVSQRKVYRPRLIHPGYGLFYPK